MLSTYYAPYPTLTNLKAGLAGAEEDAAWAAHLRQLAAELGITLPARPAGLDKTGQSAALVLEAMDVVAAQLRDMFERYSRMIHKGGAVCADLLAYNRLAVRSYEIQMKIVMALQRAKVPGTPASPPWPPLFLGFGANKAPPAASYWEIDCKARIVGWAPADRSRGVRIYLQHPECTPDTGFGLAVASMVIGAALLGSVIGTALYFRKEAAVEIAAAKEESKQLQQSVELLRYRQELIDLRTEKCAKGATGDKHVACLEAAVESVEDLDTYIDIVNAIKQERPKGRGLIWWLGAATLVAGGVVVYKVMKKRQRSRPRTAQLVTT